VVFLSLRVAFLRAQKIQTSQVLCSVLLRWLFGNGAAASAFVFFQDPEERLKKKKKKRNNSVGSRGTVFDSPSSKTWRSLRVDPSSQSEVITKQEDRTNHREL